MSLSGSKAGESAAASASAPDKAVSATKGNDEMWMRQLGRHGEEAVARERAEDEGKEEQDEEVEGANEVGDDTFASFT